MKVERQYLRFLCRPMIRILRHLHTSKEFNPTFRIGISKGSASYSVEFENAGEATHFLVNRLVPRKKKHTHPITQMRTVQILIERLGFISGPNRLPRSKRYFLMVQRQILKFAYARTVSLPNRTHVGFQPILPMPQSI